MPDLTREELIKILAISDHPRLSGVNLEGLDLRNLNFAFADLTRANLSKHQSFRSLFAQCPNGRSQP